MRFGNPTGCESTTYSPIEAVLNYLPACIHLNLTTILSWLFHQLFLYYTRDPWFFIFILYHQVYTSIMSIEVSDAREFNCNSTSWRVVHAYACAFHVLGSAHNHSYLRPSVKLIPSCLFVYTFGLWSGLSQARKAFVGKAAAVWELISSLHFSFLHSVSHFFISHFSFPHSDI